MIEWNIEWIGLFLSWVSDKTKYFYLPIPTTLKAKSFWETKLDLAF